PEELVSTISPPIRRSLALLIAAPFILAACSTIGSDVGVAPAGSDEPGAAAVASAEPALASAEPAVASAEPATASVDPTDAAASWLDIELTDAETGEPCTLGSLGGEVVAIEPMAIWCSNCKAQQDNVKRAYDDIQAAGVRFISLGIDPGEDPDALVRYAERNDYEWTFVQSPRELSRALSDEFGSQILSAPSTPLIVLDANGVVATQTFGFHGPDELLAILQEAAA
ncbi:MAG TPA: TlpA disulfide reductase family protein, partial [Anaerolineae bacterium]|nr:TlpA disulfide reductase family protein [Anaerolineae bacterium]